MARYNKTITNPSEIEVFLNNYFAKVAIDIPLSVRCSKKPLVNFRP